MTLSISLLICTKSPTTNCDEEPATDDTALDADAVLVKAAVGGKGEGAERESALSEVSDGPVTFVKIAGLNVHLKDKKKEVARKFQINTKLVHQIKMFEPWHGFIKTAKQPLTVKC